MSKNDGWEDVSHELYQNDGWEDVSHELPQPESHKLNAALQGFGNMASLGYLPQLQAMTEGLESPILRTIAAFKPGADFLGVPQGSQFEPEDYVKARDTYAKIQKDLAEKETGSYLAGGLAGGIASGIATSGLSAAPAAATVTGRILQAGKTGALMAGLANPGETEGEISPIQPIDRAKNAGIGFLTGTFLQGTQEGASKLVSPLANRAAELMKPKLKPNADEIMQTAEKLGIKPTPGMLNERRGFVERMEDSLQNSPSLLGAHVRDQRGAVQSGLAGHTDKMLGDATGLTPSQVGENFKKGLFQNIDDKSQPLSKVFDDVAESTRHIPVDEKSINRIVKNISDDDLFQMSAGSKKASAYLEKLKTVQNANQVKALATNLGADIDAAQGADKIVLSAIQDRLKNLEKNSITRAAIAAAKEGASKNEFEQLAAGDEGRDIAKQMLGDLQGARKGWSNLHDDMQGLGVSSKGGPASFKAKIDGLPNQSIQDKFLNPDRLEVVQHLEQTFPEQFKLLRAGKLRDIADASLYKGDLSAQKFVKEVSKFDPEFQRSLFGADAPKIQQMNTLINALPENFNPSGTSSASLFSWDGIKSNATDIPRMLLYKAASSNGVREGASKGAQAVANGVQAATQAPQSVGAAMGSVVNPIKPFDAAPDVTRDMDKNLLNILGKNPEMIQKIKNPKLREALMKHMQKQKDPRQSFIDGN